MNSIDLNIFQIINQFALKWFWLDVLAIFFAKYFGHLLIFFLLLLLVKNLKKHWRMVIQAFLAAILARLVIVNLIRWIFPRARPFVENNVNLLLDAAKENSFPSGHAAFYFAIAIVVFLSLKKVYTVSNRKFWYGAGFLFFTGAFLISIARVFSGIHWPSDILAGALVGIFSGWLIYKISDRFSRFLTLDKKEI